MLSRSTGHLISVPSSIKLALSFFLSHREVMQIKCPKLLLGAHLLKADCSTWLSGNVSFSLCVVIIWIWILEIILLLLTGEFQVVDLGSPAESISFDPIEFPFRIWNLSWLGHERAILLWFPVYFRGFMNSVFISHIFDFDVSITIPKNFNRFIYNHNLIWDHHLFSFISIAKEILFI